MAKEMYPQRQLIDYALINEIGKEEEQDRDTFDIETKMRESATKSLVASFLNVGLTVTFSEIIFDPARSLSVKAMVGGFLFLTNACAGTVAIKEGKEAFKNRQNWKEIKAKDIFVSPKSKHSH